MSLVGIPLLLLVCLEVAAGTSTEYEFTCIFRNNVNQCPDGPSENVTVTRCFNTKQWSEYLNILLESGTSYYIPDPPNTEDPGKIFRCMSFFEFTKNKNPPSMQYLEARGCIYDFPNELKDTYETTNGCKEKKFPNKERDLGNTVCLCDAPDCNQNHKAGLGEPRKVQDLCGSTHLEEEGETGETTPKSTSKSSLIASDRFFMLVTILFAMFSHII